MDHDQHSKANNKGPKACATCAKAKSRCIPGPRDGVCERCDRLNKPCSAQTPAPPRKRKAPKPTRVAELEKRLEDLSARVESRQQAQGQGHSQGRTPTPSDGGSPVAAAAAAGSTEAKSSLPAPSKRQRTPWEASPTQPTFGYIFGGEGGGEDPTRDGDGRAAAAAAAANNNNRHRPSHSSSVAVSHKTPDVATPMLLDEGDVVSRTPSTFINPNDWSGSLPQVVEIEMSPVPQGRGSRSGPEWPLGDEAEQRLAEYREHMEPIFPFIVIPRHMNSEQLRAKRPFLWKAVMMQTLFLNAGRQIPLGDELLNDIVTSCFLQPKKSFDLLQALEILVAWWHVKLQSFQITNLLYLMRSMCVSLGFSESQAMNDQEHDSTSLEQKRAFTGVYYLVTMIFTTNKKPDAFMNTSYLESCCRVIEEKMEYPTDEFIAYLIRTQQLSQSISMTLAFRNASLPLTMIIKGFQEQIAQLRASIPESVKKHAAIKTQLHVAEILLYEVGIQDELSASLLMTERLELLWECLKATRSMLEARFEIPMAERPRQTCLSSFDYTYAMLTSLRLSTLVLPGWDLALVRRELDAGKFLDMQIAEVRWILEKRSGGAWRPDEDMDMVGTAAAAATRNLHATLDPLETLYTRLLQLRVPLRAELLAAVEQEKDIGDAGGGGGARDVLEQAAAAAVPGVAAAAEIPLGEDQQLGGGGGGGGDPSMLDFSQDPEGPFWQDMYRVNEWETNFSSLFGWGLDDQSMPVYAPPGARIENAEGLANQIPMAMRLEQG
ncbi:hypothetical protein DHEL01_v210357 [Diaporthe helianthi]|uniref:Zn(2)-C6 fungal-type domain-containing protein n=1 Tax=Diaporthe helianthi TaxID=158607 RepID=A0A2P5HLX1_DIAHE|nr:hypothetical protein DHEL01_v210357 [Diaporthe helianthi]